MRNLIAEINRIAKMIVALNDVEFNRFKKIFDEKLHDFSVDTRIVDGLTATNVINDLRKRGFFDETDSQSVNEAYEALSKNLFATIRHVNRFLSDRTWNMVRANEIFNEIDNSLATVVTALHIGVPKNLPRVSSLLGEASDFLQAFQEAAQSYMTFSFETATTSQFNNVVQHIYDILTKDGSYGQNIIGGIDRFNGALKQIFEDLKTAQANIGKYPQYAQRFINDIKKKAQQRFESHGMNGDYMANFFNYFVGGSGEIPWDDKAFWILVYNKFNQNFRLPILNQINAMTKAAGLFLAKHSKDYSKMGADASTRYYDEANELYGQLVNAYAFLFRRLAGVGIDFNIDDVFAELKTELDKI